MRINISRTVNFISLGAFEETEDHEEDCELLMGWSSAKSFWKASQTVRSRVKRKLGSAKGCWEENSDSSQGRSHSISVCVRRHG